MLIKFESVKVICVKEVFLVIAGLNEFNLNQILIFHKSILQRFRIIEIPQ